MSNSTEVQDLAGACVQAVQGAVGVELDFTQDTLPVLDHYARLETAPDREILALLAPMLGAYFGEVVCRHLGNVRWFSPPGDYAGWRLEFERCFLYFNPIGIAAEALTHGNAEGFTGRLYTLGEDRAAVTAALETYGAVDPSDYYRFSVRFEAIEQAHAALLRKHNTTDESRVLYSPQAYVRAATSAQ